MNNLLSFAQSYKDKIVMIVIISVLLLFSAFGFISIYTSIAQTPAKVISWAFPSSQEIAEIENIVIGGLQKMDVLTTMQISNRATVKVSQDRKISRIRIGRTNLIYEGVGNVEAGINLNKVKISSNKQDNKIYIKLPSAYLKNVYLDIDQSGIIDSYKKGLGANVEQELQDKAQRQALASIKAEACSTDIIKQANKEARDLVESLTSQYDNIVVKEASYSKSNCRLQN